VTKIFVDAFMASKLQIFEIRSVNYSVNGHPPPQKKEKRKSTPYEVV
jgi:hypothetical protein